MKHKNTYALFILAFLMSLSLQSNAQSLGFVDDLSDPALAGWSAGGGNSTLANVDNTLEITYAKVGDAVWGQVVRSFDALDVTNAPFVSFEVSATEDVAFYASLSDGIQVDGPQTQGSVAAADGWTTIYLKVTTWEGQDWSDGGKVKAVDPANITSIAFKFAHGQEYTGVVSIRNLRIGSQAERESGDGLADDFDDATLPGWIGEGGHTISQENANELKIHLVRDASTLWTNCFSTFEAMDITNNAYISVKIKADADVSLTAHPGNTGTGIYADLNTPWISVTGGADFVEYVFKTSDWTGQTWPGPEAVPADPTAVNAVRFRIEPGIDGFDGNIYFKEFRVGAHAAPTELDFSLLESLVTVAEDMISGAVEGTEPGQYETGSVALLQQVVDDAGAIIGDEYTTQVVIDQTYSDLQDAVSVFGASKISDPNAGKAIIIKSTTTMVIDGAADDVAWAAATEYAVDLPYALVQTNPIENEADLSGSWKATWDEEFFYIFVDIIDENASDWASVGNPWERDLVELYFNMDGADGAISNGRAYQYPFGYVTNGETATTGQGSQPNSGSANNDWTNVTWSTVLTDDGWSLEAQFPMDAIGRLQNTSDDSLMFECSIIDQDDGDGTKTARLVWAIDIVELGVPNAGMWGKEEHMGVLYFEEASTSVSSTNTDSYEVFPNPVNNILYINSLENIERVEIYDLTGKIIKSTDINSNNGFVDTSDLTQGVYIISVHNNLEVFNQRIVKN